MTHLNHTPSWPQSFPAQRRIALQAESRREFEKLEWVREGEIEWALNTPYSEGLHIYQEGHNFSATYIVYGNPEEGVTDEIELGFYPSLVKAQATLANYAINQWASWAGWEEYAQMEMAQEQQEEL